MMMAMHQAHIIKPLIQSAHIRTRELTPLATWWRWMLKRAQSESARWLSELFARLYWPLLRFFVLDIHFKSA